MKRRDAPRPASAAIAALADRLAPLTTLAVVQRAWPEVVGAAIAAQAHPTSARGGVLTVTCASAVWAQELDLLATDVVARLNAQVGADVVRGLRCSSAPARGWS
ncbi:MAG: DciA family protein [Solirubrobacteraceae bacterium]